jgi:hypothetical protein
LLNELPPPFGGVPEWEINGKRKRYILLVF